MSLGSQGISGKWAIWRQSSGQSSTDALANWAARTRAEVAWEATTIRLVDNSVVHTVIPRLTCIKCHPLANTYGETLILSCSDQSQIEVSLEKAVEEWNTSNRNNCKLLGYFPHINGSEVSIMVCYRLEKVLIQDCWGSGGSLREAKATAAMKLLSSGHCMVQL
ncbi:hypothetical protein RSOLAG22IIIB_13128 [Rhizoctonia solani]|uniref:Uncharacterized protein n=1 Tax=Rhizoctonia solani TaxID=456999 RepID=A0A0K6GIH7_9AGAM|nr:hypothetical protein RSOLAG22IIIB_13128 [Rhizoctonia solani]